MLRKISTTRFYSFLLFIMIIIASRTLTKTPLDAIMYVIEPFVLIILLFYLIHFAYKLLLVRRIHSFEFLILLSCLIPVQCALVAQFKFGQPWFYGLLVMREYYLILLGLVLYDLLVRGKVSLQSVERIFLVSCWITLIYFYLLSFTVDPSSYDPDSKLVKYVEQKGGYIVRVQVQFIFFGAIYYFIKAIKNLSAKNIIYFLAFFFYIAIIRQSRATTAAVGLSCIIYFILQVELRKKIFITVVGIVSIALVTLFTIAMFSSVADRLSTQYINAATVVLTGEKTDEASANARIYESAIALKWIEENPLLGNGVFSIYWHGGYESLFGRFYPVDVGILGIIFTVGILGTVLVYAQFIYVYYVVSGIANMIRSHQFIQACSYSVFVVLILSLINAQPLSQPSVSILYAAILAYVYRYSKSATSVRRLFLEQTVYRSIDNHY